MSDHINRVIEFLDNKENWNQPYDVIDEKIKIKPSHKGLLHKNTGTPAGKKVPLKKELALKAHGSKAEKKRATFAINARKWHHKEETEVTEQITDVPKEPGFFARFKARRAERKAAGTTTVSLKPTPKPAEKDDAYSKIPKRLADRRAAEAPAAKPAPKKRAAKSIPPNSSPEKRAGAAGEVRKFLGVVKEEQRRRLNEAMKLKMKMKKKESGCSTQS